MTAAKKQVPQVNEPIRKSVYDIIHDNLNLATRQMYINRIFYIGKHSFVDSIDENISDYFHHIVTEINSKYYDERLTGFLLYYPSYFCHVIEGSEDTLQKHLRRVIKEVRFGSCKVLCVHHHINRRFTNNWTYITAKPATLFEKIDRNSNLENTSSKILYCIRKLYKLGGLLKRQEEALLNSVDTRSALEGHSSMFLLSDPQTKERQSVVQKAQPMEPVIRSVPCEQVTPACLPEYMVLDFLIETSFTQDLLHYSKSFGTIPIIDEYEDLVWPIASDGIPLNIFDKEFDPINDLPNIYGTDIDNTPSDTM